MTDRLCLVCGEPFTVSRRFLKLCSPSCQKARRGERAMRWHRENPERAREINRRHCAEHAEERRAAARRRYREGRTERACTVCGAAFTPSWHFRKACGEACRTKRYREMQRLWDKDNAEHRSEYNRRWREENPERCREYGRRNRRRHAEEIRERARRYHADPERSRKLYRDRYAEKRAVERFGRTQWGDL